MLYHFFSCLNNFRGLSSYGWKIGICTLLTVGSLEKNCLVQHILCKMQWNRLIHQWIPQSWDIYSEETIRGPILISSLGWLTVIILIVRFRGTKDSFIFTEGIRNADSVKDHKYKLYHTEIWSPTSWGICMSLSSHLTHLLQKFYQKRPFQYSLLKPFFGHHLAKTNENCPNIVHGLLLLRLNISYPQSLGTCRKQKSEFGGLKATHVQQFRLYLSILFLSSCKKSSGFLCVRNWQNMQQRTTGAKSENSTYYRSCDKICSSGRGCSNVG